MTYAPQFKDKTLDELKAMETKCAARTGVLADPIMLNILQMEIASRQGAAGELPLYTHDCTCCTFLGRFDWTGDTYDLYFCPQIEFPTVIARYGDEGWEYTSGMESDHPALAEARARAEKAGLL